MAKRTYIPTIIAVTKRLCQVIVLATPIIKKAYPSNTTLHLALESANIACGALNEQASLVREIGD